MIESGSNRTTSNLFPLYNNANEIAGSVKIGVHLEASELDVRKRGQSVVVTPLPDAADPAKLAQHQVPRFLIDQLRKGAGGIICRSPHDRRFACTTVAMLWFVVNFLYKHKHSVISGASIRPHQQSQTSFSSLQRISDMPQLMTTRPGVGSLSLSSDAQLPSNWIRMLSLVVV